MATIGLNTSEYERKVVESTPLPQGIYQGIVVRVQQKDTRDKTGVYEEVEFDIKYPEQYSNRKFWDRFNVSNQSVKAQQIGREGFSDLAKAAGVNGIINDDQEILGKEVLLEITIVASENPKYPNPSNACRKYWPLGTDVEAARKNRGGQAVAAAPANNFGSVGTQQAAAPAVGSVSPWKNKV